MTSNCIRVAVAVDKDNVYPCQPGWEEVYVSKEWRCKVGEQLSYRECCLCATKFLSFRGCLDVDEDDDQSCQLKRNLCKRSRGIKVS